jgi:hypothetical protein
VLAIDLERTALSEASVSIREWLEGIAPRTLNVAGPRQSVEPRIHRATARVLREVLSG